MLVGLKLKKLKKLVGSDEQMVRDMYPGFFTNNRGQKLKKQGQNRQKSTKSMPCVYFNDDSCTFNKHHEKNRVFYRHDCSSCFTLKDKNSTHSVSTSKKSVKTSNSGHG